MSDRLVVGHTYVATPSLAGARQRIVVPIGRVGERVQFAFVNGLVSGDIDAQCLECLGREVVRLKCNDGIYTVSAVCELCASDVAIVNNILKDQKEV